MYGEKQIQSNEKKTRKMTSRLNFEKLKKNNTHKEKHLKMNALHMYALTDAVYQQCRQC